MQSVTTAHPSPVIDRAGEPIGDLSFERSELGAANRPVNAPTGRAGR